MNMVETTQGVTTVNTFLKMIRDWHWLRRAMGDVCPWSSGRNTGPLRISQSHQQPRRPGSTGLMVEL